MRVKTPASYLCLHQPQHFFFFICMECRIFHQFAVVVATIYNWPIAWWSVSCERQPSNICMEWLQEMNDPRLCKTNAKTCELSAYNKCRSNVLCSAWHGKLLLLLLMHRKHFPFHLISNGFKAAKHFRMCTCYLFPLSFFFLFLFCCVWLLFGSICLYR